MAETVRKCHAEDCDLPATHHVMWFDGPVYYCWQHADRMVRVGDAVGLGAARSSLRRMTPDEMMVDVDAEALAAEIAELFSSKGAQVLTSGQVIANFDLLTSQWSVEEYERFVDLQMRLFRLKKDGG